MAQERGGASGRGQILRALRSRNYRLFFFGQGVSLIGTWTQQIAMSWLVYRLTNSPFLLGVVGFCSQAPSALMAPFAGTLADHFSRHRILIGTQALSMVQAAMLAILTLTGVIDVWHIVALAIFLGFVNAVDMPTRQSFVVEMLERKEDLSNAIALNSSLFNGARLLGPTLAGMILPLVGEGACFGINAASYLAVIIALLAMQVQPRSLPNHEGRMLEGMREGFAYARRSAPIRTIILLLAVVSLVGMPYTVLMPVFAREILKGDARTLGFLMSASGVGALSGALYLASRRSVLGLDRVIALATATFGMGLILFSASHFLWLSLALLVIVGAGGILQMASCNKIVQTIVDEDKRGRVMGIYIMAFAGTAPVGSLLAGALASRIGVSATLQLGGGICVLAALIFAKQLPALKEAARPIYIRLGILPAKK